MKGWKSLVEFDRLTQEALVCDNLSGDPPRPKVYELHYRREKAKQGQVFGSSLAQRSAPVAEIPDEIEATDGITHTPTERLYHMIRSFETKLGKAEFESKLEPHKAEHILINEPKCVELIDEYMGEAIADLCVKEINKLLDNEDLKEDFFTAYLKKQQTLHMQDTMKTQLKNQVYKWFALYNKYGEKPETNQGFSSTQQDF